MNASDPHFTRCEAILKEHPEISGLRGREPLTQFYAFGIILGQFAICYTLRNSYMLCFMASLSIGPYMGLFALVLIHEVCHNRIYAKISHNRLLGIMVNLVFAPIPLTEIFRQHHTMHHLHLGNYVNDVDVPLETECNIVGNSSVRKFLWVLFNPLILPLRSLFKVEVKWDMWVVANWVSCFGLGGILLYFFPPAAIYLFLSFVISQSFHPSNARMFQRHVRGTIKRDLEAPNTYSYYGAWNWVTLNVGYHREHHDFPNISWTRLPELRAIAGEKWYPSKNSHSERDMSTIWNFITSDDFYLSHFSGK